jgi:hypothetical protein
MSGDCNANVSSNLQGPVPPYDSMSVRADTAFRIYLQDLAHCRAHKKAGSHESEPAVQNPVVATAEVGARMSRKSAVAHSSPMLEAAHKCPAQAVGRRFPAQAVAHSAAVRSTSRPSCAKRTPR